MATTTALPGRFSATASPPSSFWDLLAAITARDISVKYSGAFLSYFWWIARPLLLGLVLYFAMNKVLDVGIENHGAFLLSGLFPWFWFQTTVFSATGAFIGNAGLIKKVRFPRIILPLSVVLGGFVEFLVTLPILVGILLVTGVDPQWQWALGIPLLMVFQFALLCGLTIGVSTLTVYVRDVTPALNSLLTLLFYMTPIIYPLERVPESYRWILNLNPLAPLIEAWRDLLLAGAMPGLSIWPSLVFAAVSIVGGGLALRALGRSMADAL
jgi:ABC-type polysaccharide/polyol phosphate export permease